MDDFDDLPGISFPVGTTLWFTSGHWVEHLPVHKDLKPEDAERASAILLDLGLVERESNLGWWRLTKAGEDARAHMHALEEMQFLHEFADEYLGNQQDDFALSNPEACAGDKRQIETYECMTAHFWYRKAHPEIAPGEAARWMWRFAAEFEMSSSHGAEVRPAH
jgi:hypothetical protein